jgi:predicted nucleic acid-binding protein
VSKNILLDTGPLGLLVNRRAGDPIRLWAADHIATGNRIVVPEICYYELRRELVRAALGGALDALEQFTIELEYAPLGRGIIVRATELWAEARRAGQPTASDQALDGDVLLAATAQLYSTAQDDSVVIATGNVGHLSRFVEANLWNEIKA